MVGYTMVVHRSSSLSNADMSLWPDLRWVVKDSSSRTTKDSFTLKESLTFDRSRWYKDDTKVIELQVGVGA